MQCQAAVRLLTIPVRKHPQRGPRMHSCSFDLIFGRGRNSRSNLLSVIIGISAALQQSAGIILMMRQRVFTGSEQKSTGLFIAYNTPNIYIPLLSRKLQGEEEDGRRKMEAWRTNDAND